MGPYWVPSIPLFISQREPLTVYPSLTSLGSLKAQRGKKIDASELWNCLGPFFYATIFSTNHKNLLPDYFTSTAFMADAQYVTIRYMFRLHHYADLDNRTLHEKAKRCRPEVSLKASTLLVAVLRPGLKIEGSKSENDFIWAKCTGVSVLHTRLWQLTMRRKRLSSKCMKLLDEEDARRRCSILPQVWLQHTCSSHVDE